MGEIKKNSAVVMRVQTEKPIGYDRLRWRGIALTTFDGRRWTSAEHNVQKLQPGEDGWIHIADSPQKTDSPVAGMILTLFPQPRAPPALFRPREVLRARGKFNGGSGAFFTAL